MNTKQLEQRIKEVEYKITPYWLISILIVIFFVVNILFTIAWNNELQSQIDALPHKVCHNETIYQERAIKRFNPISIPCPCQSEGCLAYCYMNNETSTIYYNQSIGEKEVCEIR